MLKKIFHHTVSHKRGQAVVDYALVISLVVLAVIAIFTILSATFEMQLLRPVNQTIAQSIAPCSVASGC